MDLTNYDTAKAAETGRVLEVFDPAGDPTDIRITLLGTDSDTYRRKDRELRKRRKGAKALEDLTDIDVVEKRSIICMAHCTQAWENIVEDGEEVECNPLNAKRLYETYPWLREQVIEFMRDRAKFLGEAKPTS